MAGINESTELVIGLFLIRGKDNACPKGLIIFANEWKVCIAICLFCVYQNQIQGSDSGRDQIDNIRGK